MLREVGYQFLPCFLYPLKGASLAILLQDPFHRIFRWKFAGVLFLCHAISFILILVPTPFVDRNLKTIFSAGKMSSLPADSVPERYEQAFTNFAKRDEVRRISNEDMRSFRIFGRGGGGVARPKRRGRLEIGFVHEKVGKKFRRINGVFRFCLQWGRRAVN